MKICGTCGVREEPETACYDMSPTQDGRCSIRSPQHCSLFGLIPTIALSLAPMTLDAQQVHEASSITISGVVFSDRGNKQIEGAVVKLCTPEGTMIAERHTHNLGDFGFPGMSPGQYTIQITAEGYEATVFDPGYRLSSDAKFNLYLKAEQPDSPPSASASVVSAHELLMPQKARELYISGKQKLYGEKNAQGALEDFQKALRKAPAFYEAQFQSGMAYLSLGKGAEAEASFRNSIEGSGDTYAEPDIALGILLLDRGDLDRASLQLHRATELNPSDWIACYKLADIAYRQEKLPDAEAWADKAKQIDPKKAMVYQLLAEIHIKQENYPAAAQDLDTCLELDPDSSSAAQIKRLRAQVQEHIDK